MLFSSVASLPFFDHSEIDKVIQDLETENNNDTISNTNRSSLSILVLIAFFIVFKKSWCAEVDEKPIVI